LPFDANLRVGKYLLEFGRLNPVHPHAYSFIKRPLPHETLFGVEGLADMALRAAFLLPTGETYTELMLGLLKGDALAGHEHDPHEAESDKTHEEEDEGRNLGFFSRLTSSFETSESGELAVGASLVNSVHAIHQHEHENSFFVQEQLRSWLIGGDMKYKYKPSRYTTLQVETEWLARVAERPDDESNLTSYGAYGYIDYRFHQKYNIGGILEWTAVNEEGHENGAGEHLANRQNTWRAGLFVGFAPIEETSLVRLAGHWTEPDWSDGFWQATVQLVVSLGPHQPHNF
jgi:hypothetical protein